VPGRNVLVADVGRIADDGGEALVFREFEEVHHFGARRRMARIDLDAQRPGKCLRKAPSPQAGSSTRPRLRTSVSMQSTIAGGVKTWPSAGIRP
jgi:hypothetical protein